MVKDIIKESQINTDDKTNNYYDLRQSYSLISSRPGYFFEFYSCLFYKLNGIKHAVILACYNHFMKLLSGFFNRKPFDERSPHFESTEEMREAGFGHKISFRNAWNGVVIAFMTQPNLRVHLIFFLVINMASYLLSVTLIEYIILLLISALVITAEMVNTTVEALGDEVAQGKYKHLIGVSKDVSAGAVLISAMFAALIGFIIFFPKITALF